MLPANMKKVVPASSEPVINYDFVDIADGTGVIIFFGYRAKTDAATTFVLNRNSLNSWAYTAASYYQRVAEGACNYDLTSFNSPRIVKGTAYATGQILWGSSGSTQIIFTLKKVSAGVETNISSATSTPAVAATQDFTTPITITETKFKTGDTLRLTVEASGASGGLELDPSVEAFRCLIPFKISQ